MSLKLGSKNIQAIYMPSTNSSAIIPSGIFDIPSRSGTYDVKSYAFARADFENNLDKRISGDFPSFYSNSTMSTVGVYAFAGLDITGVSLPNVVSLNTGAFAYCSSLTSISLPALTSTGAGAFSECINLTEFNFPQCSSIGQSTFIHTGLSYLEYSGLYIGQSAFCRCYSLQTVSMPQAISLGYAAFQYCSNLQYIYLPSCTYISGYTFCSCWHLSEISAPLCSYIGNDAFWACYDLQYIDFPNCSGCGNYAFEYCSSASYIYMPNLRSVPGSCFSHCSLISDVNLNMCSSIASRAFYGCSNLQWLELPNLAYIGSECFYDCRKLDGLSIYSTVMVSLANVNAFYNTPMSNSTYLGNFGTIYVPENLVDSYKSATNWVTYRDRFWGGQPPM